MLKEIETRRSCKRYDPTRPVEREKIDEIVKAGLCAANGMNRQNGIVIVITNKTVRDELSALNAEIGNRPGDPFYGAPVVLLVAVKKWWLSPYDGATMIENMLVEATHQGLGSCWIHRAKEELESEKGREILSAAGDLTDYEGVGHVTLGYPLDYKYPDRPIKDGRIIRID